MSFCAQASAKEWQRKSSPAASASLTSSTAESGTGIVEVDAVVGEYGVHRVGPRGDEVSEEVGGDPGGSFFVQLDEGKLGGAVYRDQQVGDCQIFCARGRLPSSDDEPFAEDQGELGFCLGPLARWPFPFLGRVVEHEV